jgi:hypothetical protein
VKLMDLGIIAPLAAATGVALLRHVRWAQRTAAALLGVFPITPIRYVFADQGFAGRLVDWAARILGMVIDIVRKPAGQQGFEVHRKRWVVERSLA